jgi:hypothetical protein
LGKNSKKKDKKKGKKPKIERRLVAIRLQRWVPQFARLNVAVPATWTDDQVKARLSTIYQQAAPYAEFAGLWEDEEAMTDGEGDHQLLGEAKPQADVTFDHEEIADG